MTPTNEPTAYNPVITCRACGKRHGKRHLCDALLAVVETMMDAAEKNDIPVTEFIKGEPINKNVRDLLGEDKVLTRRIVVAGGVMPISVSGKLISANPALIFTGEDADGRPLPQWVFAGSPYELRNVRDLVDRMTEMAIRRAGQ